VSRAEHLDVLVELPGHVHQHHVFGAAEGDPEFVAKVFKGEFDMSCEGLAAYVAASSATSNGWLVKAFPYSEWPAL
jgi:hypothetical protein